MTQPQILFYVFPTYTDLNIEPNLPPVDPDASKEGDKKRPSDVPVVGGKANAVWAEPRGSATMTSMILQSSKSRREVKASIVD
jgi:hypothetical protein